MESIVYNEDCVQGMKRYADGYFDVAIVDPPYGIGASKQIDWGSTTRVKHIDKGWDSEIPKDEYWKELFRVSKNQIVWGGNYFLDYLHNTRCMLVWDKMNGTNNMADCELAWTSLNGSVRKYARHIFSGVGNTNYKTIHPTQKPIEIYDWCISFVPEAKLILDTHLGSGSSRIAAYNNKIDFVGFEIDKQYFEAQEKRFQNYIAQLTLW